MSEEYWQNEARRYASNADHWRAQLDEAHAAIRDLDGYLEGNIPWDQVEALRARHASAIRRASEK